jgi:GNAT superfamily N-acetyltransferase
LITIRRIQIGETALYKQIRLASLKDAPYAFETTYDAAALKRSNEMWHARVVSAAQGSDEAIFLAFSDHLPIGIAALVRIKGQTDTGELMQVWVRPEHRGTDVAWGLMNFVFKWAKDNRFHKIIAGVTKVNTGALKFYVKYGFSKMDKSAQSNADSVYLVKDIV